jgi:hypothetical protein
MMLRRLEPELNVLLVESESTSLWSLMVDEGLRLLILCRGIPPDGPPTEVVRKGYLTNEPTSRDIDFPIGPRQVDQGKCVGAIVDRRLDVCRW